MLKLLNVKQIVGLQVSRAWPEVTGSLLASTETEVPVSIFPLWRMWRVSGPSPCFPQVCWALQVPQRARGRVWGSGNGVHQRLHQKLWGWHGWRQTAGNILQVWWVQLLKWNILVS